MQPVVGQIVNSYLVVSVHRDRVGIIELDQHGNARLFDPNPELQPPEDKHDHPAAEVSWIAAEDWQEWSMIEDKANNSV